MWSQVAVHTRRAPRLLLDEQCAAWLWDGLRRAFPDAVAAVLMPDHFHLVAPVAPERMVRVLRALLAAFERRFGERQGAGLWQPLELPARDAAAVVAQRERFVAAPQPVADALHLRRQVRYQALNPCRKRKNGRALVSDPLAWRYSTHRDVMGALADPWVPAWRLARALGIERPGFEAAHHAYVTQSLAVHPEGTPPPAPAPPASLPAHPLGVIQLAAAAATRADPAAIRRRTQTRHLFVLLARHQGHRATKPLADACGVSADAVRKLARKPDDEGLRAAALCLGDERLLGRGVAGPGAPR